METTNKTKAELYLERLEKWKAEKQQKAAGAKKVHVKIERRDVARKDSVHAVPARQSLQPKSARTSIQRGSTSCRKAQPVTKTPNPSASTKVLKPVSTDGQEKMLERLEKWKQQKGQSRSTQKIPPSASSRHVPAPAKSKCGKLINVKSRLFEYQHRPAPPADKENRVTGPASKPTHAFGPTLQKRESLKRRHSVALQEPLRKKPAGILKRKSCIGSFESVKGGNCEKDVEQFRKEFDIKMEEVDNEVFDHEAEDGNGCSSARNVRFLTPDHSGNQGRELRKTPKPSTSKSQELSDWLKAKGRTPSKFRHLLCFHDHEEADKGQEVANDPHTKIALTVDELSEQREVMEREEQEAEARARLDVMLEECMTLFEAGCPTEAIIPWLDSIYSKIPIAKNAARFYVCKAAVVKTTLDLDAVLQVFEDATINDAQPKEAIAKCLTETIKYVTEEKIRKVKRRSRSHQRRSHVQEENVFQSSSVVYVVSQATPISEGKRGRTRQDTPASCKVITPVRRSTRRSLQNLPASLKDNKEKYCSLNELDEQDRDKFLFQPNLALDSVLAASVEEEECET